MASEFIKRVYITFISFNLLFNTTCVVSETVSDFCPGEGKNHHGEWSLNFKNGYRCILKCHHDYIPSGCNVLRKNERKEWNHDVPTCNKAIVTTRPFPTSYKELLYSYIFNKKTACIAAVGSVIVASPLLLKALGFSAVGIAGGSLAAWIMSWTGPISKGSLFAYLQRLGMKGISLETFRSLMNPAIDACDGVITLFSTDCEEE